MRQGLCQVGAGTVARGWAGARRIDFAELYLPGERVACVRCDCELGHDTRQLVLVRWGETFWKLRAPCGAWS